MIERQEYSTDLSDEIWQQIEDLVPPAKSGGRPAKYTRRELLNGILYVLCQDKPWRSLPPSFPPWNTVYIYYRRWRKEGIWERIANRLSQTQMNLPCQSLHN